jgi:hypothetical protein
MMSHVVAMVAMVAVVTMMTAAMMAVMPDMAVVGGMGVMVHRRGRRSGISVRIGSVHRSDRLIALRRGIGGGRRSALGERGAGESAEGQGEQGQTDFHGGSSWSGWHVGLRLPTWMPPCAIVLRSRLAGT